MWTNMGGYVDILLYFIRMLQDDFNLSLVKL